MSDFYTQHSKALDSLFSTFSPQSSGAAADNLAVFRYVSTLYIPLRDELVPKLDYQQYEACRNLIFDTAAAPLFERAERQGYERGVAERRWFFHKPKFQQIRKEK